MTVYSEKKIKNRLKTDLKIIVDGILRVMPGETHAILLCGGYGRGEGAWMEDSEGNISPYNDYDVAVISDVRIPYQELQNLRKELANKIGISWVDIDFYSLKKVKRLRSTIKNYDLLYASKVIYGNSDCLMNSKVDAKKIGKYDIYTLYRTRLWTFLGAWEGEWHDLSVSEARFFKNQMAKAVLAACDMIVVAKRKYTGLYSERVEFVCDLYADDVEKCNMFKWALSEKKYPSDKELSKAEMMDLYWKVKSIYCFALKEALNKEAEYFLNPTKTRKYYHRTVDMYWLYVVYDFLVRHTKITKKGKDIFAAQNYVFMANEEGNINYEYLKSASTLLEEWGYIGQNGESWDELRKEVAWARNNL